MPYANEMQRCYDMQALAVRQVLASLPGILPPFAERFGGKRYARAVLLGIGSSYHALHIARGFIQDTLGIPTFAQTPEQLDWLTSDRRADTLVIAASQSGTSTNMLRKIGELQDAGCDVVALTQFLESPIGKRARHALWLDIPEEKAGPKTMGVLATAMLAAFAACALRDASGRMTDALAKDGAAFADALEGNLSAAKAFAQTRARALGQHAAWIVVGQKEAYAPAGEAALKLVETVRVPVTAYELEEIVHGPCACFSKNTALMYMGTDWEERARPEALCGMCADMGGAVYKVVATEGDAREEGDRLYLHTQKHALYAMLTLLLPAQAVSAWVAPEMGVDLDAHAKNRWASVLAGHL